MGASHFAAAARRRCRRSSTFRLEIQFPERRSSSFAPPPLTQPILNALKANGLPFRFFTPKICRVVVDADGSGSHLLAKIAQISGDETQLENKPKTKKILRGILTEIL